MLLKAKGWGLFPLIFILFSCGKKGASSSNTNDENNQAFSKSVTYLSADLPENQLTSESPYGSVIVTVESDEVINEITGIEEIKGALDGDVKLLRINNTAGNVVYLLRFKKNVNPLPYYEFLKTYEGVFSAELDGIVGLADE